MATQLLTLMYHRVHDPKNNLPTHQFVEHLHQLAERYAIVTPKAPLKKDTLNVCLTFDDAYCDFYHVVFPLLKKLNIKALLAVSTRYIQEKTDLSYEYRSQIPYPQGMSDDIAQSFAPFCTWQELREMQESGYVTIASHGDSHTSLACDKSNFDQEIIQSKFKLEDKLGCPIEDFIYPFGDLNPRSHALVQKHYERGYRIGTALNKNFTPSSQLLYRVDADALWLRGGKLEALLSKWRRKYWLNRIRMK